MKILDMIAGFFRSIRDGVVWYFSLYRKRWYVKLCTGIVSFFVFLLVYLGMVDINFLWLFGKSPGFFKIRQPEVHVASEIYSADGVLIGKFFSENRTPVKFENVNASFWKALIDTEDERFYQHYGVDPEAMAGAVKDALLRQKPRGASTITQQLAKNLFRMRTNYSRGLLGDIPGVGMLITKTKEWIVAMKLEIVYSKEEILTMYANTVEFGSNNFGIKTAAKAFFDKTPKQLNVEESAVLVGMLKAITSYNPKINPENSKNRRNVVLELMCQHGDITAQECDSLQALPIRLAYNSDQRSSGQALYFREAVANYLDEWCKDNDVDLYNDGLKIYTTIDTRMQKYAEQAAMKQMRQVQQNFNSHWGREVPWRDEKRRVIPHFIDKIAQGLPVYKRLVAQYDGNADSVNYYLNKKHTVRLFDYNARDHFIEREMSTLDSIAYMVKFMHCSFVAMEPQTGHVKAWVGDVDFNAWQYDKVTAQRQPGSTFKLFVYTEAMNQGLTPCDKRRDEYFSLRVWDKKERKEVTWAPSNANGSFSGDSLTLKNAFAKSVNSVAVRLGQEMGIERIAETAGEMGIKSPLDPTPSLALGSSDVNLLEMVNAYSTVANNGQRVEPVLVTRIVDSHGREIYSEDEESSQVIPAISAFFMQTLLMGGLTEPGGTSQALNGYLGSAYYDTDFGGKTGTTNNNSDGWFMCVSPKLVCGAWVGGEYRSIHFRTGALGQGSKTALPICGYFLQSLMADRNFRKYHARFRRPDEMGLYDSMYDCPSVVIVEEPDTLDGDSLLFFDELEEIDNVIIRNEEEEF